MYELSWVDVITICECVRSMPAGLGEMNGSFYNEFVCVDLVYVLIDVTCERWRGIGDRPTYLLPSGVDVSAIVRTVQTPISECTCRLCTAGDVLVLLLPLLDPCRSLHICRKLKC